VFANEVAAVQPGEVAARVAEGWMLLDVRTDDEWAGGRIAGSAHIPMDQLMQRMDEVDARVDGGLHAWASSGFPVEH